MWGGLTRGNVAFWREGVPKLDMQRAELVPAPFRGVEGERAN